MKYRPEIDGLRAVAVLPVLFFHAGFGWAKGGFVGVDIFFVISGYLITSILLEDLKAERFSMLDFYDRRLRRIVPALFVMCMATIPPAWLWMLPEEFDDYAQSLFATSVSVSNLVFWDEADYFAASAELKPLLHTWSLAVEDQYYLIFPLLLAFLFRRKWVVIGIGLLALLSFGLTQILASADPAANFYLLPTRFWELGVGCLIAAGVAPAINSNAMRNAASIGGLALIVVSIFLIDGNRAYPGWWTLPSVFGTALVIAYGPTGTLVARLLGWKPLVAIGLISYSTYLWHQPLFAFARIRIFDGATPAMFTGLILLSLAIGYLSWRFVERPFRDRRRITRKSIFVNTFAVGAALFGFGLAMDLIEPNGLRAPTTALAKIEERMAPNYGGCGSDQKDRCQTSDQPEILVWGDSYAMHLIDGLLASKPDAKIIQLTKSLCGPIFDYGLVMPPIRTVSSARDCHAINQNVKSYIERTPSIKYVIMSGALSTYVDETVEALVSDRVVPASPSLVETQLLDSTRWLAARNIRPIFVTGLPIDGRDIGACMARYLWFAKDPNACAVTKPAAEKHRAPTIPVLDSLRKEFTVIDLADYLCDDKVCKVADGETIIYRDAVHMTREGSRYLGKLIGLYDLVTRPSVQ